MNLLGHLIDFASPFVILVAYPLLGKVQCIWRERATWRGRSLMCGIFGVLRPTGLTISDTLIFEKFFDLQNHRGPDGKGQFVSDRLALGMRRLSVIDLEYGWQPQWSEDKSVGIVANGEIYNYLELRESLIRKGHVFQTESDIEVIVHLYEEYGMEFVHHLRGMFAFALIDLANNALILGRDRMGEKPLYIADSKEGFFFSSELRSLVQSGAVPLTLNAEILPLYFQYGFVPEPLTFVAGIRKLQAGTLEKFDLSSGEKAVITYWRPEDIQIDPTTDPVSAMRDALEEVGKLIVRADVPIGVALSSGIDSTIIAAMAAKNSKDVHTFTVGYTGKHSCDESDDAVKLALEAGLTPHTIKLEPKTIAQNFKKLCLNRDEPIADIAGAGYEAVSALAAERGVKVLLNGQGGDEIFWGYAWVKKAIAQGNRRAATLRGDFNLFDYVNFYVPKASLGPIFDWVRDGFGLVESLRQMKEDLRDKRHGSEEVLFYKRKPRAREILKRSQAIYGGASAIDPYSFRISETDGDQARSYRTTLLNSYLRVNGLSQMDRLSMANSVESRTPLVDYRVVEIALSVNYGEFGFGAPARALLLEAVSDWIPDHVKMRPKKGFTPPVREWYRAIFSENRESFLNPRIVTLGLVNENAKKILSRPLSRIGRPSILWLELAVLEMWIRGLEETSRQKAVIL